MRYLVLYLGNTQIIEWADMKDSVTEQAITNADVSVTLKDQEGGDITDAVDLDMPHVSDGTYRGTIPHNLDVEVGDELTADVVAVVNGEVHGRRTVPVRVEEFQR